jgi:hypothetical protein
MGEIDSSRNNKLLDESLFWSNFKVVSGPNTLWPRCCVSGWSWQGTDIRKNYVSCGTYNAQYNHRTVLTIPRSRDKWPEIRLNLDAVLAKHLNGFSILMLFLVETLSRRRRHRHDGTVHDIYISVSTLAHPSSIVVNSENDELELYAIYRVVNGEGTTVSTVSLGKSDDFVLFDSNHSTMAVVKWYTVNK